MDFDSIKGLLNKKKAAKESQPPVPCAFASPFAPEDPYATVMVMPKDDGFSPLPVSPVSSPSLVNGAGSKKRSRSPSPSRKAGASEPAPSSSPPPMPEGVPSLSEAPEVNSSQRQAALAEATSFTQKAVVSLEEAMRRLSSLLVPSRSAPVPLQLPAALIQLMEWCLAEGLPDTAGKEEDILARLIEDSANGEGGLVAVAAAEEKPEEGGSVLPASTSPQLQQLTSLLNYVWFFLSAQWWQALREVPPFASTWPYPVHAYVRYHAQLPPHDNWLQEPLLAGKVKKSLHHWSADQIHRRHSFHLMACLYHDYCVVQKAALNSTSTGQENCLVPSDLVSGIEQMAKHLQSGNPMAARQAYTDFTQGSDNWKLGLFSGGEVHMRRSMERVERHRIAHLLNNERAMNLLYSVRKWISFYEGSEDVRRWLRGG